MTKLAILCSDLEDITEILDNNGYSAWAKRASRKLGTVIKNDKDGLSVDDQIARKVFNRLLEDGIIEVTSKGIESGVMAIINFDVGKLIQAGEAGKMQDGDEE